jgi:hypothetical protein
VLLRETFKVHGVNSYFHFAGEQVPNMHDAIYLYCFEKVQLFNRCDPEDKRTLQLEEYRRTNKRMLQEKPSKLQKIHFAAIK